MEDVKLPLLPEPFMGLQNNPWGGHAEVVRSAIGERGVVSVYTDDQMQDYARQAVLAERERLSQLFYAKSIELADLHKALSTGTVAFCAEAMFLKKYAAAIRAQT